MGPKGDLRMANMQISSGRETGGAASKILLRKVRARLRDVRGVVIFTIPPGLAEH